MEVCGERFLASCHCWRGGECLVGYCVLYLFGTHSILDVVLRIRTVCMGVSICRARSFFTTWHLIFERSRNGIFTFPFV